MEDKQTRINTIVRTSERAILDRIVEAMLAAEDKLFKATEQEWTQVLTASCRSRKRQDGDTLATTC